MTQEPTKQFLFSNDLRVRIDDLNYGNHLAASQLSGMIHNTRALFLKKHNMSELNFFEKSLMVHHYDNEYKCEGFFDDLLEFKLYFLEFQKTQLVLMCEVFKKNEHKLLAVSKTFLMFVDPVTHKLSRPPKEAKQFFQNFNENERVVSYG